VRLASADHAGDHRADVEADAQLEVVEAVVVDVPQLREQDERCNE